MTCWCLCQCCWILKCCNIQLFQLRWTPSTYFRQYRFSSSMQMAAPSGSKCANHLIVSRLSCFCSYSTRLISHPWHPNFASYWWRPGSKWAICNSLAQKTKTNPFPQWKTRNLMLTHPKISRLVILSVVRQHQPSFSNCFTTLRSPVLCDAHSASMCTSPNHW